MNFEENFRAHGQFDISALRKCVEVQSEDIWTEDQYRQNKFAAHADTATIPLIFDKDFRHIGATRLPRYEQFAAPLQPLVAHISEHFDWQGWVVRCILAKLRRGGRIPLHSDGGFSLMHAHRFHIPVITNHQALFTVGDETIHMRSGEIWEINNRKKHGVVNEGSADRVHLILDWAEPLTYAQWLTYVADQMQRKPKYQLPLTRRIKARLSASWRRLHGA
jgi:hypothetical protein